MASVMGEKWHTMGCWGILLISGQTYMLMLEDNGTCKMPIFREIMTNLMHKAKQWCEKWARDFWDLFKPIHAVHIYLVPSISLFLARVWQILQFGFPSWCAPVALYGCSSMMQTVISGLQLLPNSRPPKLDGDHQSVIKHSLPEHPPFMDVCSH